MNGDPATVGIEQLRLIERSRAFLDGRAGAGRDVALDPECYLNSWSPCLGFARLRSLAHGASATPARLSWRLRDAARSLRVPRAEVRGETSAARNCTSMVVSWALPTDFDAEGHYRDRYLNLGSRDTPHTLWFVLLLSGQVPPRLASNVRVYHQSTGHIPARAAGARLSGTVLQAEQTAAAVLASMQGHPLRRLVMPYEAQPFQHAIVRDIRRRCPGVETVGYVHSALPALPTDYLFRDGAPDRLLVHGDGQREILTGLLGWSDGQVSVIDSLRYLRSVEVPFAGRILLPYAFDDADFIVAGVESMMAAAAPGSMPRWQVRNHPVQVDSPGHRSLMSRLETALARHADRGSDDPAVSSQTLMIGATAAVIEALERGLGVVHICPDALFQKQSREIWRHLDVELLAPNVYRYRLSKPGAYIRLGEALGSAARLGLESRST